MALRPMCVPGDMTVLPATKTMHSGHVSRRMLLFPLSNSAKHLGHMVPPGHYERDGHCETGRMLGCCFKGAQEGNSTSPAARPLMALY